MGVYEPPTLSILTLPSEIRHEIYLHLLVQPQTNRTFQPYFRKFIYQYSEDGKTPDLETCHTGPYTTNIHHSILLVNHQIHSEASPILYNRNRFSFPEIILLLQFLSRIGRQNAAQVFDIDLPERYAILEISQLRRSLQLAPNLQRLRIRAHTMSCAGVGERYLFEMLNNLKPLLEAHPSLDKVVSPYPSGFESEVPRMRSRPYQAICLTLLASQNQSLSLRNDQYDVAATIEIDLAQEIAWLSKIDWKERKISAAMVEKARKERGAYQPSTTTEGKGSETDHDQDPVTERGFREGFMARRKLFGLLIPTGISRETVTK